MLVCCILHNVCLRKSDNYSDAQPDVELDGNEFVPEPEDGKQVEDEKDKTVRDKRDKLVTKMFGLCSL